MTISPVWPSFSSYRRTDRQTDMTKLMVCLRNFAKAPKNTFNNSDPIASYCRVIIQKLSFKRYEEKRSWRDSKYSSRIFV